MRNLQIAAGVALALAGVSVAQAAIPSAAQCAAPNEILYIAGSSAAQNAFANALATDLFGGAANLEVFSASNGNFKVYCGFANPATAITGIATNDVVAVHYRGEGGSVVGALPIVSGNAIQFLDLTNTGAIGGSVVNSDGSTTVTVNTTGTSATVGTTDGWGGGVAPHAVEVGITDLEPSQFHDANYPSAYSTTAFGSATATQLQGLATKKLFGQVFGIYVNPTNLVDPVTGVTPTAINLSRETVSNILVGNYKDWSKVPSATGGKVSSASVTINLVNREAGSGTRTGTSVYFLNYGCGSTTTITDPNPAADGFATGDVLTTAAATGGSLTYASVDNAKTGLLVAQLSGVTPSSLAAASGQYDWWFEATFVPGTIGSAGGTALYNWLSGGELQNVATAPHTAQIVAIPNVLRNVNVPTVPLTSNTLGGKTIYVNPFSRGTTSCNLPVEKN
jgi:hypothetical protein